MPCLLSTRSSEYLLCALLFAGMPAAVAQPLAVSADASLDADMSVVFAREVKVRLDVPPDERTGYARRLDDALTLAGIAGCPPQYFVMVDRSPAVQAAFIYWRASQVDWRFIGASPVSTGRPGEFDHFWTPLGVFDHTLTNMDFRAEGTLNKLGIRGYGGKGMRVYDFGWVNGERAWGPPGRSQMRLQMHATDPDILEKQLGQTHSKGCIRIPATLNRFIDHYGLLDADYERAASMGERLWVLRPDREPTPWAGRYLVVVDSERKARPTWSPGPLTRRR